MSLVGRLVFAGTLAVAVSACAAGGSDAKSPSNAAAAEAAPSTPAGTSGFAPAPPPPPPATPMTPSATSTTPAGGASSPRSAALAGAASDLESSQRELDVAAGDCRNACRALGSMDRAAGRLCELAQDAEVRRCEDAKQKVYSARDRVKTTCGSCPDGPSVDRKDPIPSKGSTRSP